MKKPMEAKKRTRKARFLMRIAALCLGLCMGLLCALPAYAGDGKGNTEPEELHTESPLYGKKALFCGDSICAAAVYDYENMPRWGWAGRIARDYGMTYVNKGLDGASVSNVRGDNTILAQLRSERGKSYDFVILHGGTNDGWDEAPVGEMTPLDQTSGFDPATFAGGLETLFSYAKRNFAASKIGFIINYQTPTKAYGTLNDMSAYYDLAKKICDKWEIPYLDLYNDANLNKTVLQVTTGRFALDKIHLNGRGYDRLYPYIAAFMEKLAEEAPPSGDGGENTDIPSGGDVSSGALTSGGDKTPGTAGEKDEDGGGWYLPVILGAAAVVLAAAVVCAVVRAKKREK